MKIIHFILAVYVVCLAVYPCNDGNVCPEEKGNAIAAISANDFQQGTGEEDVCSPFCVCTCCASQVHATPLQNVLISNLINNTVLRAPYMEKPSLKDHQSIFQPPRA